MIFANNNSGGGSITETDPIYNASPAKNITSEHISVLDNTSGINTGDQDLSALATKIEVQNAKLFAIAMAVAL